MLKIKALFILAIVLLCAALKANSQNLLLKIKYLPNHTYNCSMQSNSNIILNIIATAEQLKQMKAKGVKLPMTMVSATNYTCKINTGAINEEKYFPINIKYIDIHAKKLINDVAVPEVPNLLSGQNIYAHSTTEDAFAVDSVSGKTTTDSVKLLLANVINYTQKQIHFPDKPLNIGDTFTQDVPMSLPINGMPMNFTIKTIYKFVSIEKDIAVFDLTQIVNYTLSKSEGGISMTMTGDGTGKGELLFAIKDNFPKQMQTDLNIKFKVNINEMIMTGDTKISAVINNEVLAIQQ